MDESQGRNILLATYLAAIALATWSEMKDYKVLPRPQRYVGAAIVWGLLGLMAPLTGYKVAGIFGIGMLLTLLYQHYKAPAGGESAAPNLAGGEAPTGSQQ